MKPKVVVFIASLMSMCICVSCKKQSVRGREELVSIRHVDILCTMVLDYQSMYGRYPSSLSELDQKLLKGRGLLEDGWGQFIIYRVGENGHEFELISMGADGVLDTKDDIISSPGLTHEYGD